MISQNFQVIKAFIADAYTNSKQLPQAMAFRDLAFFCERKWQPFRMIGGQSLFWIDASCIKMVIL